MKNVIALTVGDWSGDGHGLKTDIHFEINATANDVGAAYRAGVVICGVDLVETVCEEYQDRTIPEEIADKFRLAGIDIDHICTSGAWSRRPEDRCVNNVSPYEFAELYLGIAKLGNPGLEWQRAEMQDICIGGYGLLYR